MGKKRPARTEQRARDRAARQLVRDRERLATLEPGGSRERPITVDSAAVVEVRAGALACVQCGGSYRVKDHQSAGPGLRRVIATCTQCGVTRDLWFRLGSSEPN